MKVMIKMKDEMLTIPKEKFIDLLTRSDIFNSDGVKTVLENSGFASAIEVLMIEIENLYARSDYYKSSCRFKKEEIEHLHHLLDRYENPNDDLCSFNRKLMGSD